MYKLGYVSKTWYTVCSQDNMLEYEPHPFENISSVSSRRAKSIVSPNHERAGFRGRDRTRVKAVALSLIR
jgi:hypothetical protein